MQRLDFAFNPGLALPQCCQRCPLPDDGGADGDGVLHLEQRPVEAFLRGVVGQVPDAPAHQAIVLAEAEYVDDSWASHAAAAV